VIALIVATLAVVLAVISLAATGTMALRLRLVTPSGGLGGPAGPQPVKIATLGRRVDDVLGSLIDVEMPTSGESPVVMRDSYLLGDGAVLAVSTSCGACRFLLHEARDLLSAESVRAVVVAPTIERGIEFVEKDCRAAGILYQVDPDGRLARALGVEEFPSLLRISDGLIAAAHVALTRQHLGKLLHSHGGDRNGPAVPHQPAETERSQ
jgi:hypothetical protein